VKRARSTRDRQVGGVTFLAAAVGTPRRWLTSFETPEARSGKGSRGGPTSRETERANAAAAGRDARSVPISPEPECPIGIG